VAFKAEQTERLLAQLARQGFLTEPSALREWIGATFLRIQECWQARDYEPVRSVLAPSLFDWHCDQLRSMRENGEVNRLQDLRVCRIEFVYVHFDVARERKFTVLITFQARSDFVDDRSGHRKRGDRKLNSFQEFWSFQQWPDGWRLSEIQPSCDATPLARTNLVPMTTAGDHPGLCYVEHVAWATVPD
jgi:hypothetical protein